MLETVKSVMQFTHLNVRTSCVRSCDTSPTVNLISLNRSGRLEERKKKSAANATLGVMSGWTTINSRWQRRGKEKIIFSGQSDAGDSNVS